MCNKMTYETKGEAIKDARLIENSRSHFSRRAVSTKDNRKLRPYLCKACGYYHLTTRSKRKYD